MRFIFLLIFLAGAAAGIGYPFLASRLNAGSVDIYRAYAPPTGFRAVEIPLKSGDAPLDILVDLSAPAPFVPDRTLSSVSVTAAHNGKTLLARTVSFRDAVMRDDNPQTPERTFRAEAGTLPALEDGAYTFTLARGETEIPQVTAFDLVLRRRAAGLDGRVQPVGFMLMAVGFIGFMLAAFRRSPAAGGAPPTRPKPRWGRNAGQ